MLARLYVENVALIDKLDIPLGKHFNVLTGETGAGKSIIIDSVKLALGARADKDLIKSGEKKALVEALFYVSAQSAAELEQMGFSCEDGQLLLTRELTADRSVCKINGRPVTLSMIKAVSEQLVDLYGQHEHQSLLDEKQHLLFIDSYSDESVAKAKRKLEEEFSAYSALCTKMSAGFVDVHERERRIDTLNKQIDEIHGAQLSVEEEDALVQERAILLNGQKIQAAFDMACQALEGSMGEPIMGALKTVKLQLEAISAYSCEYEKLSKDFNEAYYQMEDSDYLIGQARSSVPFDPYRQEKIENRLDLIYKLKRKYGSEIRQILQYEKNAQDELDAIEENKIFFEKAIAKRKQSEKALYDLSAKLHTLRVKSANQLCAAIVGQLKELGMQNASFSVEFEPLCEFSQDIRYSANGLDRCEMMFSANAGEQVKPLRKVASGGELSRLMLAFKSVCADVLGKSTLIFDEIDSGISGRISQVVGEKMNKLALSHQVICITHSAQIAALANNHFLVEKSESKGKTFTTLTALDEQAHIAEVARIMSGATTNDQALALAGHMVEKAGIYE